ncbi:uncharacterized protein RAG0_14597 [Rhynchosporium agropyri]|uniref:Uncharacterized protein n=1 Tax=Rhynchosporium agropyri TaxID=914238 RepID=A0A1E1LJL0_9HELO|nr:uncharacterized protein RAG0_14597 [Rhynchosporium agropyri]
MSVLSAWKISADTLKPNTAKFLYLLCFLDATYLRKDLFQRACSPKSHWDSEGNEALLHSHNSKVPTWLIELFCNSQGTWNDLMFHDAIEELSSLFFINREERQGVWLHKTGPATAISSPDATEPLIVLIMPQALHDLGKCFKQSYQRQETCLEALYILLHAFQNDTTADLGHIDDSINIVHVGRGGALKDLPGLLRQLDELDRQMSAIRRHEASSRPLHSHLKDTPLSREWRSAAIMFAAKVLIADKPAASPIPLSLGLQVETPLAKDSLHDIFRLAGDLEHGVKRKRTPHSLGNGRGSTSNASGKQWREYIEIPSWLDPRSGLVSQQVETSMWITRQQKYFERACSSSFLKPSTRLELSVHRFTAIAQGFFTNTDSSLTVAQAVRSMAMRWKSIGDLIYEVNGVVYHDYDPILVAYRMWIKSDMCLAVFKSNGGGIG